MENRKRERDKNEHVDKTYRKREKYEIAIDWEREGGNKKSDDKEVKENKEKNVKERNCSERERETLK